ncbi:MAG: hypothetical protein SVK08_00360 [Halobacteriota archaeon]|nr:hypothetical protein [Halobacteriota archaeon]
MRGEFLDAITVATMIPDPEMSMSIDIVFGDSDEDIEAFLSIMEDVNGPIGITVKDVRECELLSDLFEAIAK